MIIIIKTIKITHVAEFRDSCISEKAYRVARPCVFKSLGEHPYTGTAVLHDEMIKQCCVTSARLLLSRVSVCVAHGHSGTPETRFTHSAPCKLLLSHVPFHVVSWVAVKYELRGRETDACREAVCVCTERLTKEH